MILLVVANDKVDVSSISLSQESTILIIVYAKTSAFSLITVVIYIMLTSVALRDVFVFTLYGRAILVQVGPY